MSTEPENLHEAVYQAIGAASVCWVGGTGDLVFDSTQAATIGADLIEWIEEWHRSEQPSYLPSGMDEFASNERTDHLPLVAPPGWNQVEETMDEYWAAMAKRDPDGPQP
jgi:hypothetical protein